MCDIEERKFVIRNQSGSDILGGEVGYRNAYISLYPSSASKPIATLGVEESAKVEIALCGQKAQYTITRVS